MTRPPVELVACARDCHARGLDRRAVLRTCYGVEFPEEVFVLLDLDSDFDSHVLPWSLAKPDMTPAEIWLEAWAQVYARHPRLVPLDESGGEVLAYSLDELELGRPTVFAIHELPGGDFGPAERVGDSFLSLRHARAVAKLRHDQALWDSPYAGGYAIEHGDVVWQREQVEALEELLRELEARMVVARTV